MKSPDYDDLRRALTLIDMGKNCLIEALEGLSKTSGGCVSYRFSRPHPLSPCSLTARICALGLRQEGCGKWERMELE